MKKMFLLCMLLFPCSVLAFNTSASSAILMDMDSGRVLYSKNARNVQSVASISKIMTAIVAIENSDISKVITVGDEINEAYGSGIYVKQGEQISLEDLLYGLMLRSGNDAALVIAVNVAGSVSKFVDMMNDKAREIGMDDSIFNNPSGLDEEKGNYSSAYDMALLMSYAMGNDTFKKIVSTKKHTVKTNKNTYVWHNKNKLLSYSYITGGKTGYTKIAKRTLVSSAHKNGLNLTVVTLNDGNDWEDHIGLYEEAFKKYEVYDILSSGDISILGEDFYSSDQLYLKDGFSYPLLSSEEGIVSLKFSLDKKRGYKDGDKVGEATVKLGDKVIGSRDIYVKITAEEGVFSKIKKWFND